MQTHVQFYPASWENKAIVNVSGTQKLYEDQQFFPEGVPYYTPFWLLSVTCVVAATIIITLRMGVVAVNKKAALFWTTMLIAAVLIFGTLFLLCEVEENLFKNLKIKSMTQCT